MSGMSLLGAFSAMTWQKQTTEKLTSQRLSVKKSCPRHTSAQASKKKKWITYRDAIGVLRADALGLSSSLFWTMMKTTKCRTQKRREITEKVRKWEQSRPIKKTHENSLISDKLHLNARVWAGKLIENKGNRLDVLKKTTSVAINDGNRRWKVRKREKKRH